jgi:mRNA-degrading endonuclease toxin of MazEF toxin-antitoxin module
MPSKPLNSITVPLCLALVVAVPLAAQAPASFSVRVTAKESGAPLGGVQVSVRGEPRIVTDDDGRARVEQIPPGMHIVAFRRIGYVPETFLLQFAPGAHLRDEVVLEPDPVAIAPVEVRAERTNRALVSNGFYARRATSNGEFLDREAIERVGHGRSTVSSVLRTVQGLRLEIAAFGRGFIVTSGRANPGILERHCYAQVIVDNVPQQPVRIAPGQVAVVIDGVVSLDEVEAIEWYRGPSQTPVQFNTTGTRNSGAACGTLVIWTRMGGGGSG